MIIIGLGGAVVDVGLEVVERSIVGNASADDAASVVVEVTMSVSSAAVITDADVATIADVILSVVEIVTGIVLVDAITIVLVASANIAVDNVVFVGIETRVVVSSCTDVAGTVNISVVTSSGKFSTGTSVKPNATILRFTF